MQFLLYFLLLYTVPSIPLHAIIEKPEYEHETELVSRESIAHEKLERSIAERERAREADQKIKEADRRIEAFKVAAKKALAHNDMEEYNTIVQQQKTWETTKRDNEKVNLEAQDRANKLEKNAKEIIDQKEELTKTMEKSEISTPEEEQFMRCIKTNVIGSLKESSRKNVTSSALNTLKQLSIELKRLKNYERINFVATEKLSLTEWQKVYTNMRNPKTTAQYDPTYREILARIDKLQAELEKEIGTQLGAQPTDQAFACRFALFVKQKAIDKLDAVTNWDI